MQARDPASYVVRSSKFRVFQTLTYTSMPTITMSPSVKIAPIQVTETKLSPPRSMGKSRARSNSIVKVEDVGASQEQVLDQSAYANNNAEWVNRKGILLLL